MVTILQNLLCKAGLHAWSTRTVEGCVRHQYCNNPLCDGRRTLGEHTWGESRESEKPCHRIVNCTVCLHSMEYDTHIWDDAGEKCITCGTANTDTGGSSSTIKKA